MSKIKSYILDKIKTEGMNCNRNYVFARSESGSTALDWAIEAGDEEAEKIIREFMKVGKNNG